MGVSEATNAGRETVDWRRQSPFYIVTTLVRHLRGIIIPYAIVLFTRGGGNDLVFYAISLGIAVIAGLFSFFSWLFFRYALTPGSLEIRSGVISREERSIPYERIQAVDLEEPPLERFLRIARVSIDTAAGHAGGKIRIHALSRADAEALRRALAERRARTRGTAASAETGGVATSPVIGEAGEVVRALSLRELLVAGMTSGRVGAAVAIVGAAAQFADDIVPRSWWSRAPSVSPHVTDLRWLAGLFIFGGVIAWLLAILSTALTFGGFVLRRADGQLLISHGLLERRRATLPIRRIQAVRIEEGWLRQPFRLTELRFDSAGHGTDKGDSGVLFPLLPRSEVGAFLARTLPELAVDPQVPLAGHLPRRAARRYMMSTAIGWVIFAAIATLAAWRVSGLDAWWGALLFAPAPLFVVFGWLRYRDAGWSLTPGGQLRLRWRAIGRTTLITRRQRIQHRGLSANPFQRRATLATVHVAIASGAGGGHLAVPHLDAGDAERLLAALSPASVPQHDDVERVDEPGDVAEQRQQDAEHE